MENDRLEYLSDQVRMGIPISFIEALEVIEYQALKPNKKSIWKKTCELFNL